MKKEKRGGARLNAGAKPKYGEQTTTIAFRVPVSKIPEIKNVISKMLNNWKINKDIS